MSTKSQGMISKRDEFFSRWRNVDNDSADATSNGRSFQIRGPTIWKAPSNYLASLSKDE